MSRFSGQTVVITGAAGGIGQELCRVFGREGAQIGALDQSEGVLAFAESLQGEGIRAHGVIADIADHKQVVAAFDAIRAELGGVNVLINNAGFSNARALEKSTPETWEADIATNLNGPFYCTREALVDMKRAGGGAIVNIGSVNGLMALGDPAYGTAKAGLINYTKSVALEYGPFGIRANVICPGTVRTPIWADRVEKNPEILSGLVKFYPLRRVADPVDIANAAAFLASDDARSITGVMLPVDCGLTAGNIAMARELTLEEF
ncbi:MAG: SDR family oxidoreductase [Alphaproteobacteria bacterium]|nr:SDR family oxidoreductase [Alphaproteobacteria bacterium]